MNPIKTKIITTVAAVVIGGGAVVPATTIPLHQDAGLQPSTETRQQSEPQITNNIEEVVVAVAYDTEYVDDSSLPKGQTKVITAGKNGERTDYYEVTYIDGVESKRELTKSEITFAPVTQIVANGSYVAPPQTVHCENGSYVNSAGNTVCRPSQTNTGSATAICGDGSYSYSQSRRGTCSHHGGVARWL